MSATAIPESRFWNSRQVAARLGRRDSWLYQHLARLEQIGFPRKDKELGLWDSKAIEAWLDRRAGIDSHDATEHQMLEAIHGQNHAAIS